MTAPVTPQASEPIGVAELLLMAWRGRRWLLIGATSAAAIGAGTAFSKQRTWTSVSVFSPQQRRGSGGALSGFAAQLGVQVPSAEAGASPALYADLVRSDEVLWTVIADTDPEASRGPDAAALRALLEVDDPNPERADVLAVERLANRVTAAVNPKTQVVRVSVQLPSADAALAVHQRVLAALADLNQRARQTQASAERRFTEARLKEVEAELRDAESALRLFAERNRQVDGSPTLRTEQGGLEREVSLRQQVFVTLAQSVEQARIEEVRDTPMLSILQQPRRPAIPDGRGAVGSTVLGGVAGLVAAMFALVLRLVLSSSPRELDPRAALRVEWARAFRASTRRL